jgi:hypothetical protein
MTGRRDSLIKQLKLCRGRACADLGGDLKRQTRTCRHRQRTYMHVFPTRADVGVRTSITSRQRRRARACLSSRT